MAGQAELFAGGSAFQWAGLGIGAIGALGGAARAASAPPPGDSSADALFGSVMTAPDFSNWNVVIGPAASATMTVGPKTGPVQAPSQTQEKVNTQPVYTSPGYGGGAGYTAAGGAMPIGATTGTAGGIPMMWLLIGAAIWLATKKS